MKRSEPLDRQVEQFLSNLDPSLLSPAPLIVAVSGGPDSLALLHVLHGLAPRLSLALHVAHLHHGQRPEADADAEFVAAQARSLGWTCTVGRADVPEVAKAERLSIEVAGRTARYRFLSELALNVGAAAAATGHHAGDQAETVLMRAFRGAGVAGLRGIPAIGPMPESNGRTVVIRPLIGAFPNEIHAFLRDHGIAGRLDSTNLDRTIARNRLRLELLPLAEAISPGARRGLVRVARAASEDEDLLDSLARAAWERCARVERRGVTLLRADIPPETALRRRVLRRAFESALNGAANYPERGVDRLLDLIERVERDEISSGSSLSLPRGLQACLDPSAIRIETAVEIEKPPSMSIPVTVPGRTALAPLAMEIEAKTVPVESVPPFPVRDSMEAVVDADAIDGTLFVRTWEPGDRIRVLGSGGTRKLQDLFTNARVPAAKRPLRPLLCDASGIVWVPGVALSDGAKITPRSRRALRFILRDTNG